MNMSAATFAAVDANSDGVIDRAEFEQWQQTEAKRRASGSDSPLVGVKSAPNSGATWVNKVQVLKQELQRGEYHHSPALFSLLYGPFKVKQEVLTSQNG